jgi:hypothetical protein
MTTIVTFGETYVAQEPWEQKLSGNVFLANNTLLMETALIKHCAKGI